MESFMQTAKWEEFQKSYGRKVWRVENQLVVKYNLPLNTGYLCSFRPDLANNNLEKFLSKCQQIAKEENCIFLHLEPIQKLPATSYKLQATRCLQPQQSLILDILKSEEEILAQMHQKTRYNIRLAEKKGIKVRISNDPKDMEIFWRLASETSSRGDFHFHPKAYYQKMLEILEQKYKILDLIIAEYKNQPLAVSIILYHDKSAIYLHGSSGSEYRNLMAPHLAQWTAIKQAKKRGCITYDFWGIAPLEQIPNNKSQITNKFQISNLDHPWSGITRFKLGFAPNGKYVEYPQCLEIIYQKTMYQVYNLYRKLRNK